MIFDPAIEVACDRCGETEWFGLTLLARHSWDTRHLAHTMLHAGWTTTDDEHLCPDCTDEQANGR